MLGPFPQSRAGNTIILVVVDQFTKWVECLPLPSQCAEDVAEALITHVISRFGCPLEIFSDQGRNFESSLFIAICTLLLRVDQRVAVVFNVHIGRLFAMFVSLFHWRTLSAIVMAAWGREYRSSSGPGFPHLKVVPPYISGESFSSIFDLRPWIPSPSVAIAPPPVVPPVVVPTSAVSLPVDSDLDSSCDVLDVGVGYFTSDADVDDVTDAAQTD